MFQNTYHFLLILNFFGKFYERQRSFLNLKDHFCVLKVKKGQGPYSVKITMDPKNIRKEM